MRDRMLRSLARNPAIPGELLRRIVDERLPGLAEELETRPTWTDDQFDALAAHPDPRVRVTLALARDTTADQRARLADDPHRGVRSALADGPPAASPWDPPTRPPASPPRHDHPDAGAMALSPDAHAREEAARCTNLPADLVALLATDPSPRVRLQVSMRPELTEAERAAIDYHVGPDTFAERVAWVSGSGDPEILHRCVHSAHPGLRRAAAMNRWLPPDLVAVLARDDDPVVRLLLAETHADVPTDVVVDAYLFNGTFSKHRLLGHPNFSGVGLARLADSPNPGERAASALDPAMSPEVVDRLSRDPVGFVRARVAGDPRLSRERVLELYEDPETSVAALGNPHLPVAVMEEVLSRSS